MMTPEVSVVLCTYNRAHLLVSPSSASQRQRYRTPFEVVVVDNNSTDVTAAVVREAMRRRRQMASCCGAISSGRLGRRSFVVPRSCAAAAFPSMSRQPPTTPCTWCSHAKGRAQSNDELRYRQHGSNMSRDAAADVAGHADRASS
jgi:glycosyltransferase involved in cell wall biosynthesis